MNSTLKAIMALIWPFYKYIKVDILYVRINVTINNDVIYISN